MTNTDASLSLLSSYEAIARHIGYDDHPDHDGLVFTLGDHSRVAVLFVDDYHHAAVRVCVAELRADGEYEFLSEESFEADDPDELHGALDRAALSVS